MENLNDLYKHSMTHPDVAEAYIKGLNVPEAILQNEVPDTSVSASFDPTPDPETYTVTVAVADGQDDMGDVTVEKVGSTGEPGKSVTVNAGDSVQIKATAAEDYAFDAWTIDGVGTEYGATDTIENVSEDIDLVAEFKQGGGKGVTKGNTDNDAKPETEEPVENPENDLPGTLDDSKDDEGGEDGEEEPKKE